MNKTIMITNIQLSNSSGGCGFHYLKALQEIKVLIDSKHHHQQVHEILTLMYKEQDPKKYDDLADSLQKLSSAPPSIVLDLTDE